MNAPSKVDTAVVRDLHEYEHEVAAQRAVISRAVASGHMTPRRP